MITRRITAPVLAIALLCVTMFCFAAEGASRVKMTTSMGTITLELNEAAAPETVKNFLSYVNAGHYNGTIFHRVISGFMIQGGGFEPGMQQRGTNAPIRNEADNGLRNEPGTIAMARTSDPHSATAQFFINTANNQFLNHTDKSTRGWGYTVFGKVTDGMDVVRKIEAVSTGRKGPYGDVPNEDVIIEKIEAQK
jgi:peptidyl-prolyl cis-trans isomerase B (cyclophilin B)